MKYRIPWWIGPSENLEEFEADTDTAAVERHRKFKEEKEKTDGKWYYHRTSVGGLVRVDQEQRTTKIL